MVELVCNTLQLARPDIAAGDAQCKLVQVSSSRSEVVGDGIQVMYLGVAVQSMATLAVLWTCIRDFMEISHMQACLAIHF